MPRPILVLLALAFPAFAGCVDVGPGSLGAPRLAWRQPLTDYSVDQPPVVVGDVLVVPTVTYTSQFRARLAAFDLDSGKPLWQRSWDAHGVLPLAFERPTIVGTRLVLAEPGTTRLIAIDASTGATVTTGPSPPCFDGCPSWEITAYGHGAVWASAISRLYKLSPATLQPIGFYNHSMRLPAGEASGPVDVDALIYDFRPTQAGIVLTLRGIHLCCGSRHAAAVIDPQLQRRWTLDVEGPAAVGAEGDEAFLVGTDGVVAIDASNGRVLWRHDGGGQLRQEAPAVSEHLVIARKRSEPGEGSAPSDRIIALRRSDGGLEWERAFPGRPMVYGGHVFAARSFGFGEGDGNEFMAALRLADGSEGSRFPLPASTRARPALYHEGRLSFVLDGMDQVRDGDDLDDTTAEVVALQFETASGGTGRPFQAWWALLGGAFLLGCTFAFERGRFRWWSALAAVGAFSRLERDQALAHRRRAQIYDAVGAEPGLSFSDLRRRLELSNGALVHHLRVLQREAFVRIERAGMRVRLYPAGGQAAVRQPYLTRIQLQLVEALKGHPGATVAELARLSGVSPRAARYQMEQLRSKGLVRIEAEARGHRHYWLAAEPRSPTARA